MAARPKILNKEAQRQHAKEQIEFYQKILENTLEVTYEDLVELHKEYLPMLTEWEYAASTIKSYKTSVNQFLEHIHSIEGVITKNDVISWKETLIAKGLESSTINNRITGVNKFFYNVDLDNLAVTEVKVQKSNTIKHRIDEPEYRRLLRKAKSLGLMDCYWAMRIMAECGARHDELKFYTSDSIQKDSVSVFNKKKFREIPIPAKLIGTELRKYVKDNNIEGELIKVSYDTLRRQLKRISGLCKVKKEKVHPHAFRHLFALSYIKRNGSMSISQLADILGHSNMETTRTYLKGTITDYAKAMERE